MIDARPSDRAFLDMHEVEHTISREELLDSVPAFARIVFGPHAETTEVVQSLLDDEHGPRPRVDAGDLAPPSR
jgi:hypothetical protein